MSGNGSTGGWYIAPSNDRALPNGNYLRVAAFYVAFNKITHLLNRRRLQEGDVLVFTGNGVHGSAKAFGVVHADLAQFDFHE